MLVYYVCISKSIDAARGFSIKDQSIGDAIAFFVWDFFLFLAQFSWKEEQNAT